MNKEGLVINGMVQELRRGSMTLAVLSQLKQPQYGYSLVVLMKKKGFEMEANTLYPLLRRLEKQGILNSVWNTERSKPRKFYQMSEFGQRIYRELCDSWKDLNQVVNRLKDEE